jgi:hypothetical protein
MTDKEKYLLLAGIAAAGLAYWYFGVHAPAAAAIVSQPAVPQAALPSTSQSGSPVGVSAVLPVGSNMTSSGQDVTQLNALLAWATQTQNPTLYAAMINQLDPSDLNNMYNILTTAWDANTTPTVAQAAFWSMLNNKYPFLKVSGVNCTNFACTS